MDLVGRLHQWNFSSDRRSIFTDLQQLLTPSQCLDNCLERLESLHALEGSDVLDGNPSLLLWVRLRERPEVFVQWEVRIAEIEFDLLEDFGGIGAGREDGGWIEFVVAGTFCGWLAGVGTGEICGGRRRAFCGGDSRHRLSGHRSSEVDSDRSCG